MSRLFVIAMAAASLVLAAGASAAVVAEPRAQDSAATIRKVDARILSRFALLRRSERAGDLAPVAGRPWATQQGINARLGRRARKVRAAGLFMLPGRKTACLYLGVRYGSFACNRFSDVLLGRLYLMETRTRSFVYAGFVPDGSHRAVLRIDGRTRRLAISGNAIAVEIKGKPRHGYVAWSDASGKRRSNKIVPLPPLR